MNMDTFQSAAVSGLFVTMPSATSSSTLKLIDTLGAMKLDLYRPGYEFSDDACGSPFATGVMTQIVDQGYAVHRMDTAFRIASA